MLYQFVKIIARAAIKFYCRDIQINKKELFKSEGPLLLAVNHPNSFLDAIILCTLFNKPIYSLARGDAFNGKLITKILVSLKLLPVYRISEGVENISDNYNTFDRCKKIFNQNGIVLIFIEGRCINEWHLRPLMKGTARLAISSWQEGIPLKVLPIGINYSSFNKFGKNIHLFLGDLITAKEVDCKEGFGKAIQSFNKVAQQQLSNFVYEIEKSNKEKIRSYFFIPQPILKKIILFAPSIAGWLLHAPLYYPLKKIITKKTNDTDHFDSIMVGLLFFTYPLYVLIITLSMFLLTGQFDFFWLLLFFPLTAWSHLQLKKQVD
ncbi:MAG: glycerol acyltransferase [Chitinophagia bacterium]|nr:glycerol acyltransferase [Chitinophagia bacterium]